MNLKQELARRAPNVDQAWADDFVTELSLRGADGREIGAALLEVESHMAEHGGDVESEFGAAREYAASLDLPDTQVPTTGDMLRLAAQSVLSTLGWWIAITGVTGFFSDTATIGLIPTLVLTTGVASVTLFLARWRQRALRWVIDHLLLGTLAATLVIAIVGGLATVTATQIHLLEFDLPPLGALIAGFLLILAWVVWIRAQRRSASETGGVKFPVE